MSSSYKGFWINGSKESGYTAEQWRNGNALVARQPTLAAVKRAIVQQLNTRKAFRALGSGPKLAENLTITEITKDRVSGFRVYPVSGKVPFDVKHNGAKFYIGSGSAKSGYYFNEDKSPINM